MLNYSMLATYFIILGPIPSNPIALLESKVIIETDTCSWVILEIWKYEGCSKNTRTDVAIPSVFD